MAKIILNNIEYSINDSVLAPTIDDLKSYFTTEIGGTDATINLDGVVYNIDSAKLLAATNNFISYLNEIAGNGNKVIINGIDYFIDSTKISNAFSNLETALGVLSGNNGIQLMSIDNFVLKDSNELYLTAKEDN